MLYNYCRIIVKGNRVVKEVYSDDIHNENHVIKFKWSDKNYEALPFLTDPVFPGHKIKFRIVPLHIFYYIIYKDNVPYLCETMPKPYPAPGEYETVFGAKKAAKRELKEKNTELNLKIAELKKTIEKNEKNYSIIDFLEPEED